MVHLSYILIYCNTLKNLGTVEQWGEVSHKKDKKAPINTHATKPPISARGDFRGGRGGRGGPGRGGAATRGRSALPRGSANGHHPDGTRPYSVSPANAAALGPTDASYLGAEESTRPPLTDSHDQNGLTASTSAWTDTSSQPETSTLATSISANGSTWGATDSFSTEVNGAIPVANIPVSKVVSKTPATSKLSWAQIARSVVPFIFVFDNVILIRFESTGLGKNQRFLRLQQLTCRNPHQNLSVNKFSNTIGKN
jgi:hypothetical protein